MSLPRPAEEAPVFISLSCVNVDPRELVIGRGNDLTSFCEGSAVAGLTSILNSRE